MRLDPQRPLLMGIVNANADSFSDGVRLRTLDAQVAHALALVADGAQIIDVGGESGVTYTPVSAADEEITRVVPLVARLVAEGVVVSVDTWKAPVAEAALDAGATILNDVSGLRDERLADLAARHGAHLVVMHTRAEPKHEHFHDYGGDVVGDVRAFLSQRLDVARARGVPDERLIVDPGPDFAKTPAESVAVLRAVASLGKHPLLLALSRKYFVGAITARAPDARLGGTLGAVAWASRLGLPCILRLHDVREAADLLAVQRVLDGLDEVPDFDAADERLKWLRADS
jgi:dihydropteroate synthase